MIMPMNTNVVEQEHFEADHEGILMLLTECGYKDENPRAKYEDGTPAYSYRLPTAIHIINPGMVPLTTLRPIYTKKSIGELLWIYQDQSNDLDLLKDKYGVTWWDEWDIGDRTIGSCYGHTVKKYNLIDNLIKGLKENPFGRRHMIDLYQYDELNGKHGLDPCAYQTVWNVTRHEDGKLHLHMNLFQRSSDYVVSGCINLFQYKVLQMLIAQCVGMEIGNMVWFCSNCHIYDRHIDVAKELLKRDTIELDNISIDINKDITNFYDFTMDDIKVSGYSCKEIAKINPQVKFDIAI